MNLLYILLLLFDCSSCALMFLICLAAAHQNGHISLGLVATKYLPLFIWKEGNTNWAKISVVENFPLFTLEKKFIFLSFVCLMDSEFKI